MNVFVTGGTRGIGRAIVEAFLVQDNLVYYTYKNSSHIAGELDGQYAGATGVQCDMCDSRACESLADRVLSECKEIHVLVNNAGINEDVSFLKMSRITWENVIQANLTSLYNFTHPFFVNMSDNMFGRIINISSVVGQTGAYGQVNYSASKAGVLGFTKALALEGAKKNITVNAIAPGYINTEMVKNIPPKVFDKIKRSIPLGYLGRPEDIAHLITYLASREAEYITGQIIGVNGGL